MSKFNIIYTSYTLGIIDGIDIKLSYSPVDAIIMQREDPDKYVLWNFAIRDVKILPIMNSVESEYSFVIFDKKHYVADINPIELGKMKKSNPNQDIKIHLVGDDSNNKNVSLDKIKINEIYKPKKIKLSSKNESSNEPPKKIKCRMMIS